MNMRIALVQQRVVEGGKTINAERGLQAVRKAADHSAQIICFAELAFESFYPQHKAVGDCAQLAEEVPGPMTEMFGTIAKELGVVIVLNIYERDGEMTYDCSPVIDADGSLIGKTRMIHITDYEHFYEKGYYEPGDCGPVVYDTKAGKVGVAICYDRHYPEYMRALALNGAEVVVIPQAGAVGEWPDGLQEAEIQTASFQNGYFAALCNRVGREECLEFAGESFITDPAGRVIARAGAGVDDILYGDIELDLVRGSCARRLFMRDRRPELYGPWLGRS